MLNFCPLCVVEVYALRCDAMRAGTSHYPLHHPTTTYCFRARNRIAIRVVIPSTNSPMTLQRYAVFLYLQNLDLSTSKRCIKMGIESLKSAILYCVSLYFHLHRINIANINEKTTATKRWIYIKESNQFSFSTSFCGDGKQCCRPSCCPS